MSRWVARILELFLSVAFWFFFATIVSQGRDDEVFKTLVGPGILLALAVVVCWALVSFVLLTLFKKLPPPSGVWFSILNGIFSLGFSLYFLLGLVYAKANLGKMWVVTFPLILTVAVYLACRLTGNVLFRNRA